MPGGLGEDLGMIGVKSELNGDLMAVGFNGKGVYSSCTLKLTRMRKRKNSGDSAMLRFSEAVQ